MKSFLVEHKDWDKPPIRVVLYQPPYEDENILNKTGWNIKDVKITELDIEEIEWTEQSQYLEYL